VTDASPLNDTDLRNDFEHIDTRLEKWHTVFPMGSLNLRGISRGLTPEEIVRIGDPFGHYNRDTGVVIFWSPFGRHSVSLPNLVAECQQILASMEAARRNRRGVIPHDEWLALQEDLRAQGTSSTSPDRPDDRTAQIDSRPTEPEAPHKAGEPVDQPSWDT
jgi:hypothetical protein